MPNRSPISGLVRPFGFLPGYMSSFLPALAAAFRNVTSASLGHRHSHCVRCERTTAWITDSTLSAYRCTSCGRDAIEEDA